MTSESAKLTPVQMARAAEQASRFTKPGFWVQIALLACLLAEPLLVPSFRVMDVAAKIVIFAVLVASYDLLLGYTGIFSMAHALFFGIGAYSLGLIIHHSGGAVWWHLPAAAVLAVLISGVVSLLIAIFSLRLKALYFVVMTLALAQFGEILAMQMYNLTGGEDGVSFKLPGILDVAYKGGAFLGVQINGRMITYYLVVLAAALLFVGLVRFVRSPTGRVLKSIRDNEQRSTALGYKTFNYQVLSNVFASTIAALAGVLYAAWVRYVDPESAMATGIMLNVILMLIIGGLGTMYGSIVGTAFIFLAETWMADGLKALAGVLPDVGFLQRMTDRWLLYFGILFVLVVIFFPKGIVGSIRDYVARKKETAV